MTKLFSLLLLLFVTNTVLAAPQATKAVNPELKASLAAFFAAKPSANGAVAELVSVKHWPEVKGKVKWSLPNLRYLSSRISLIAEQGKGKMLRRWYVAANVKWMKTVVTLKKDISARTLLDRSMLIQKRKNIAGIRGRVWARPNDVVGLKSLRNMRQGDVVHTLVVKRPPLIKRGDQVTILVEVSGIKVRASGIALKSGSLGERMLVQNVRSKQRLQSIVKDAHTVSIQMGGV
ncbi:MAG: flagellar basal body P-ring formation chaperone FlgA [Ghiorsea sp.]